MSSYDKLTDNDKMPFGKYKGMRMIDVPAKYFLYMYEEMNLQEGSVRVYIEENLEVLRKEAKDEQSTARVEKSIKQYPKTPKEATSPTILSDEDYFDSSKPSTSTTKTDYKKYPKHDKPF